MQLLKMNDWCGRDAGIGLLLALMLVVNVAAVQAKTKPLKPAQAPKKIQLTYALSRDDQLFAHTKETFTQEGKQYRIQSVTKGVGVYALLGERKLLSNGNVTKDGLQPLHFESLQLKNASKALINDFDWTQKVLRMQVKGESKEVVLEPGTQDLLSVMYQFRFVPPTGTQVAWPVTTGKKLKRQQYQVTASTQSLQTAAGHFNVMTLVDAEAADSKTIYLAQDAFFIPVKIVMKERGTTIVQELTKIAFN